MAALSDTSNRMTTPAHLEGQRVIPASLEFASDYQPGNQLPLKIPPAQFTEAINSTPRQHMTDVMDLLEAVRYVIT